MKHGITVNKSKLYHLAKDCWPRWYPFPRMADCQYTKITPFLFVLRWSSLKIEFQYFSGEYFVRYHDAISGQDWIDSFHPLAVLDYGMYKV